MDLDRLQVDGWIWGAAGTILALLWVCWVIIFFLEDPVEILDQDE